MYIRYPSTSGSIGPGSFPLLAPDGSASAPSYANSTGKSGMYFGVGEIVDFSANQTKVVSFAQTIFSTLVDANLFGSNSTSEVGFRNNITSTGFMAFAGNSTTGSGGVLRVYGSTHATKANIVEFATAGTARNQIDASGNIVPVADVTYDIGASATKYKNIYGSVVGTTTNNNATAGNVGEYVESVVASQNAGTTATWTNLTSISLTAGDYSVDGIISHDPNGAAMTNVTQQMAVSINSGITTTDHVVGSNVTAGTLSSTTGVVRSCVVPSYRISISGTTTVYLKTNLTFTTATPLLWGRLSAIRIR